MNRRSSAGSESESGSFPSYCSNCGEKLEPAMNFCPNCGANCEELSQPPSRSRSRSREPSVSDRDVLEYRISKAVEAGWELEHDFGDHAVMVRRNLGGSGMHVLIALFTIWWTMGAGNALYAIYCYYSHVDRMILRPNHVDASGVRSNVGGAHETNSDLATDSSSGSVWRTILPWLGVVFMLALALSSSTLVWTGFFIGAAIALGLVGLGLVPPIRRRLANRRSITTNGWTRSVDERSVVDSGQPCTSCAAPVGLGVERTYRKEFALLGVPLTTKRRGTNRYCRRCANAEFDLSDPSSTTGRDDPDPDSEREMEAETPPSDDAVGTERTETGESDSGSNSNSDLEAEVDVEAEIGTEPAAGRETQTTDTTSDDEPGTTEDAEAIEDTEDAEDHETEEPTLDRE